MLNQLFRRKTQATLVILLLLCSRVYSQDTIPFRLGSDNRIYLKVNVNDSQPLDFMFDTGAAAMVANTTQINKKIALQFDGKLENRGANGVTTQRVSSGNTLQIGKFSRKNEELIGIAYPEDNSPFDGVIGYPYFEDYLIEVDYKKQRMVLHKGYKTLSEKDSYETLDADMTEHVPFVDMTIYKGDEPVIVPVMIDTGFDGSLIVYHKMIEKYGLENYFPKRGSSAVQGTDGTIIRSNRVVIPKAVLGNVEFPELHAFFNITPSPVSFTAILGGNVLKEIHWVFDFKKNKVLMKVD